MLQFLFPDDKDMTNDNIEEVNQLLQRYAATAASKRKKNEDANKYWSKFEIWSLGLQASILELSSSYYATVKFRQQITSTAYEEMTEQERLDYARYVYFDKNGFIRVFSLLDKLGTFLNELLELRTEHIKAHFSYFTVLRTMREKNIHIELMKPLNDIKEGNKESTHRLRRRRNTEIHYMNSEMHDDLLQQTRMYGQEIRLENLDQQTQDLAAGLDMVIQSVKLTFQYAERMLNKK